MRTITYFPPGIVSIQLHGSRFQLCRSAPTLQTMCDNCQLAADGEDTATCNATWCFAQMRNILQTYTVHYGLRFVSFVGAICMQPEPFCTKRTHTHTRTSLRTCVIMVRFTAPHEGKSAWVSSLNSISFSGSATFAYNRSTRCC